MTNLLKLLEVLKLGTLYFVAVTVVATTIGTVAFTLYFFFKISPEYTLAAFFLWGSCVFAATIKVTLDYQDHKQKKKRYWE